MNGACTITAVIPSADVVIIGSGAFGASAAYQRFTGRELDEAERRGAVPAAYATHYRAGSETSAAS